MKTAIFAGPSERSIAALAYRLWLDRGCPAGSSCEDWFLAESALCRVIIAEREEPVSEAATARSDTRTDSRAQAEFEWSGHWEVWEREWGGAHWVADLSASVHRQSHIATQPHASL